MSLNGGGGDGPQRRRGAVLEKALLEAAWAELNEQGYEAFTMESVAQRAGTSRAVLYRRWDNKPDLVREAIRHNGFQQTATDPDTGTLRGDLIGLLSELNDYRLPFAILMTTRLGAFYADTGMTMADLREEFLGERRNIIDEVLERAVARGEADPARLTPRVRSVLGDLYRHEVLMTQKPVPMATIEAIVDEIVLPLVRAD